jgi:hypothetical protein
LLFEAFSASGTALRPSHRVDFFGGSEARPPASSASEADNLADRDLLEAALFFSGISDSAVAD